MALLLQRSAGATLFRIGNNLLNSHCTGKSLLPIMSLKCRCTANAAASTPVVSKQWTTIYRLPSIRWAAAFNRIKLYQAFLTVVGTPAAYALEEAGHFPTGLGTVFGVVGLTGLLTLAICSLAAQNLVGFIYINEAEDKVKLAYVDYWGRRKEREIEINDILIDSDRPSFWSMNSIQAIQLESDAKQKYKLVKHLADIVDHNTFTSIFGE